MTQDAKPRRERPLLKQATIPALQDDGVKAFVTGTITAGIVFVVCWLSGDGFSSWRLQASLAAVIIGVFAIGYCLWRRGDRRRKGLGV